MIFAQFFGSNFPICSTILCMPIPTIFFPSFPTWGFHIHFIEVKYMIGGPIGRSVVCFGSPLCSSPYSSNPPYSCFPFLSGWYTYSMSCVKCGSCVFTIVGVINIRSISATNEVCSLVSLGVGPLYIISFLVFLFPTWVFIFCVFRWGPHHLLSCLWLKLSMRILGQYVVSYACRSLNDFCDAFVVLHLVPGLLVSCNVPISRYFATLCWISY
jgi:hypothetical protein